MGSKSEYSDFLCGHCGRLVKAGTWSSHVYYPICPHCNGEFWNKWYQLPKCKKVENGWIRTDAHDALIKEYHKEEYFKWKDGIF